tara:strand:+ start:214 stop:675 length:462 start_codon:yes stop_codon:yes gene_type:complete
MKKRHGSQIGKSVFLIQLSSFPFFMVMFFLSCFSHEVKLEPLVNVEYSYYSNGKIEFSAEYVNGKLDGVSMHWAEDGTLLSEAQYSEGRLNGYLKKYFSHQVLMGEINYSHGEKHGVETWYHENGTLKSEQTFIHGIPQDDMVRWRSDGSIIY